MRSIEEIYQEMKDAYAAKSGFELTDGCDMSVRFWAAAAQIQALGIQADWVLDQSFPQTAADIYLDRHAAMRGITRLPAVKASGMLRFYVKDPLTEPVTVAAGTVCMSMNEQRFQTVEEVVLQPGERYVEAAAEALEGGSGGNVVAGSISILTACPVSITGCTNPAAFTGGSDREDDETLRSRVLDSYQRLPNGANTAWYETTAMTHTGVAAAKAVGRARGIGTVDVYIAAEQGLPDEELLARVQADLQEKREIAVDVEVKTPAARTVDVSVALTSAEGKAFERIKAAAEETIIGFFNGRLLGQPMRLADIGNCLYHLEGVENYRILAPAEDISGDSTTLPVLGTLTVTEMEA